MILDLKQINFCINALTVFKYVDVFYHFENVTDTVAKLFETRIDFIVTKRYDWFSVVVFFIYCAVFVDFQIIEREYVSWQYDFIVNAYFKASGSSLNCRAQLRRFCKSKNKTTILNAIQ